MASKITAGLLGAVSVLATACGTANVGIGSMTSVPKDARSQCATICSDIGMSVAQLIVMANEVGCVCEGGKGSAENGEGATSGAAGGVVAVMQQRRAAAAQQQAQMHH